MVKRGFWSGRLKHEGRLKGKHKHGRGSGENRQKKELGRERQKHELKLEEEDECGGESGGNCQKSSEREELEGCGSRKAETWSKIEGKLKSGYENRGN